ncbi:MAG: Xaa-Pro peptidase family protein [Gammaproteobacteria bacterium]
MTKLIPAPQFSNSTWQKMCDYRLARLRQVMAEKNINLCILANPISLRYAIDFDEYQVFQAHIPTCYLFVPIEGPLVMHGAISQDFPNVASYQRSRFISPFDGGFDLREKTRLFANDVKSFIAKHQLHQAGNAIALERFTPLAVQALESMGLVVTDADCLVEQAKVIKSSTEIECIKHSIAVTEYGMHLMQANTRAGMTERQLWSILHQVNVANNGCWMEGHMLSSGPRTNPWLQEATERVIEQGDMIAFDTDLIGPRGYMADISRSWVCGGGTGTQAQRDAYQHAFDEVHFNIDIIKPGMSFAELAEKAFKRKKIYQHNHYVCVYHGAGLSDEYPKIYYQDDWAKDGYDGIVEVNTVLCVESYSGAKGGTVGVKLEQMVLVNETGTQVLTHYPFEDSLIQ